ncbi:MAG: glycosyltransferase [Candidatus Lokiarchaeota archaeon]|nr:glycosyltransferase [Candidatus Lokiarchaeota archaeon]
MNVENKLTIGLPVYNGENFLASTLESLLNQTFKDFILIISDNASTDKTKNICKEYAQRDSRIRYVQNKFNIGPANNFQKVLKMSNTQYFMWAAHDDLREPTFIEDLMSVLEKNHNIILASSNFDFIDNKGHQLKSNNLVFFCFNTQTDLFKILKNSIHNNMAMMIYGIYRTSVLKKMGGLPFNTPGTYGFDGLFLLKLCFFGKFHFYPKVLFHKRRDINSKKNSLINRLTSTFKTIRFKLYGDSIYRHLQRKIILKQKISIHKKIVLFYETCIAQVYSYLVITIEILNKMMMRIRKNSKANIKLNKFFDKFFLKEHIL